MSIIQNQIFKKSTLFVFGLKSLDHDELFFKIAISISCNTRIKIVCFDCINFVYGPLVHKILNKINLIEIKLHTNCQNWEA